ncbi:MAG: hypothetical protein HN580_18430 [Deltaproteobacteria bacterium]|jgi:rubrerythrin|nr:hypothetical protein [Deltaproteobacteria bacterium]MBT4087725.1 hypothetical protein [Deltaproteobacteria bacterium]MBT4264664.1 hypothetical protein [Deltaproteobacteria bacterium]MBT4644498.1 hypothetical protein [Deltaproteobacteria bacterium]MBT6504846.1 hypothetical protein [Deltaproteobacteria bacterium]
MNIEEAIKTSIEYEEKVTDVYNKYANKFESEIGAKIFRLLGKEEDDHVAYLKAKLAEWQKSGKVSIDEVKTVVPDAKVLKENVKKLKKIAKQENIDNEIAYFQKALEMEIKTSNFYKGLVSQLPKEFQPMFERFVEIEEGHEAIVSAEIDNARGLGFWFDFQEFDLESA